MSKIPEKNGKAIRMTSIVEDGPVEKKLKKEGKAVIIDDQEEIKNKSFDDLPNEMVMKILKYLVDQDLYRCRRVNRQWIGVSSEILQSRANFEFQFDCYKVKDRLLIKKNTRCSFKNLIKCFEVSQNYPHSRLRFDSVQKMVFEHEDWIKLANEHGERIKCLILGMKLIKEDEKFEEMMEALRDLLLNQLPSLQQFGLQFSRINRPSNIHLFPITTTITTTTTGNSNNSKTVRLPNLKVLHLDESAFTKQSNIITDILIAAVNLKKIEFFSEEYGRKLYIKNCGFLQALGKLHLLQRASIEVTRPFLSSLKENGTIPKFDFKLEELELVVSRIKRIKHVWSDGTIFLSNLFESSKDSFRKITVDSMEFLKDVQLPKFSKLNSLRITDGRFPVFPSERALLDSFPVLHSLELDIPWRTAFPHKDSIPVIPSLKNLKVSGHQMEGNCIAQISVMCPNLKSLNISAAVRYFVATLQNFPEVGKAIWTHLNELESLEISVGSTDKYSIDSCITGISKEECQRLHELFLFEESLKEVGLTVPEAEWKTKRGNVSILNMKDLKNFTMQWTSRDINYSQVSDVMTEVSQEYALKLMDNLTYNIHKRSY